MCKSRVQHRFIVISLLLCTYTDGRPAVWARILAAILSPNTDMTGDVGPINLIPFSARICGSLGFSLAWPHLHGCVYKGIRASVREWNAPTDAISNKGCHTKTYPGQTASTPTYRLRITQIQSVFDPPFHSNQNHPSIHLPCSLATWEMTVTLA